MVGHLLHSVHFFFDSVFGGYAFDGRFLDDVQIFDTRSLMWTNPILNRECCDYEGATIEILGQTQNTTMPGVRSGFQGDIPLPRVRTTQNHYNVHDAHATYVRHIS